jgi:signal recognition particle subunit SRP54
MKAEEDAMRMPRICPAIFDQIRAIKKMGPLQDLVEKLPFFSGGLPDSAKVDDYELVRIESIINSMTPAERKRPDVLNESRIRRVAHGAGRKESEVRDLLTKFKDMRDLMVAVGGARSGDVGKGSRELRRCSQEAWGPKSLRTGRPIRGLRGKRQNDFQKGSGKAEKKK